MYFKNFVLRMFSSIKTLVAIERQAWLIYCIAKMQSAISKLYFHTYFFLYFLQKFSHDMRNFNIQHTLHYNHKKKLLHNSVFRIFNS